MHAIATCLSAPATTTPAVEMDAAVRQLLETFEERITIVHCFVYADEPVLLRIWPETCLVEDTGHRRQLLKALGISVYPHWTRYWMFNNFVRFTLVFEGLSKACRSFCVEEAIPEPYGFYSEQVARNATDVYKVLLHTKV